MAVKVSPRLKGIVCGLAATALWGSFYPVSRLVFGHELEHVDPLFVAFLRNAVCTAFLIPFLLSRTGMREFRANWRNDLPVLLLLAFSGVAEGVLVMIATRYTTAARASLLANAAPIFTVLIAWALVHDRPDRAQIVGMVLGFAGIVLAGCSRGSDLFTSGGTRTGDLMALGSGFFWGVYTVLGGKAGRRYDAKFLTAAVALPGLLMMVPALVFCRCRPEFDFSPKVWLGLLYLGAGTGSFALVMWYQALKYLKAGELGSFGYATALLAVVFAVIFLRERFAFGFLLAIPCVLGGIGLMFRGGKRTGKR